MKAAGKKDLYMILGVSSKAKDREVQRAYLKIARRVHPDVNPGDHRAAARFKEIQEAYLVLSNRKTRERYDRKGEVSVPARESGLPQDKPSRPADSRGWENIVRDIFHDHAVAEPETGSADGDDIHQVLEIAFQESLRGVGKQISYQREAVCRECSGRGFAAGAEIGDCPGCVGSGLVKVFRGPYLVKKICPRCGGSGETGSQSCKACGGKGRSLITEKRTVHVPAGSDSGTRITVAGGGQPGKRGGASGDLAVTVRVQPHPQLERRGYNLYSTVQVTVAEAALGATILVPTAERKVSLKIPGGTQSGQQFRLRGKGVPLPGGRKRGDFFVNVSVIIPAATDQRARRLFREIEKVFPENPRVRA